MQPPAAAGASRQFAECRIVFLAATRRSSAVVSMSPALDKRLKALGGIGAHVSPRAGKSVPPPAWLVLAPVMALVAGLMSAVVVGLLFVSLVLSGLFTWLPALLIHALLR